MTLLELYEKLCTGEIRLADEFDEPSGLCYVLNRYKFDWKEFQYITCRMVGRNGERYYDGYSCYIGYIGGLGKMTPERETFLLLFAAYKGEL